MAHWFGPATHQAAAAAPFRTADSSKAMLLMGDTIFHLPAPVRASCIVEIFINPEGTQIAGVYGEEQRSLVPEMMLRNPVFRCPMVTTMHRMHCKRGEEQDRSKHVYLPRADFYISTLYVYWDVTHVDQGRAPFPALVLIRSESEECNAQEETLLLDQMRAQGRVLLRGSVIVDSNFAAYLYGYLPPDHEKLVMLDLEADPWAVLDPDLTSSDSSESTTASESLLQPLACVEDLTVEQVMGASKKKGTGMKKKKSSKKRKEPSVPREDDPQQQRACPQQSQQQPFLPLFTRPRIHGKKPAPMLL